jgi:uncharacterized membrane protein YcaP (DUF421 family)
VNPVIHVLFDSHNVVGAAVKTSALFLTASVLLRFTERRTLAEFAPFDWIAAVAAGAIVGRAATATDTSWLTATAALICLLLAHAVVARLRFVPIIQKFIDPPLQVLIRDGRIDCRSLRRCGLTIADLNAVLRQHGHLNADQVHLAVFEAKGAISVLPVDTRAISRPDSAGLYPARRCLR